MMNAEERKEAYDTIIETLKGGGAVLVSTYTKATHFNKPSHADLFQLRSNGLYARYGKNWLCIDGCAIRFGYMKGQL